MRCFDEIQQFRLVQLPSKLALFVALPIEPQRLWSIETDGEELESLG